MYVRWTYAAFMPRSPAASTEDRRSRGARLDFRVDARTKRLVERAARVQRRNLTDFCLTTLADAARKALDRDSSLILSEADRAAFFDALLHPPEPGRRLRRAVRVERSRVER